MDFLTTESKIEEGRNIRLRLHKMLLFNFNCLIISLSQLKKYLVCISIFAQV